MVQTNVRPLLCSALGHPALGIKQSEMIATSAGLGDSQVKPSYESRLAAASARPGSLSKRYEGRGSLRPAVACLVGFRKL